MNDNVRRDIKAWRVSLISNDSIYTAFLLGDWRAQVAFSIWGSLSIYPQWFEFINYVSLKYYVMSMVIIKLSNIDTVFENHRKSRIQHCERSELRLHFEWTKVNQKCQKWFILANCWKNLSLRSNSFTRQVIFNRQKIDGKCQNSNAIFQVIFKHCVFLFRNCFEGRLFLIILQHCDAMCVESSEQTRLMLVHQNSSSLLSRCHRDESFVYDVVGEKSKTRVMDL